MSLTLLILKINTTFEDVQMMLKRFFDFSTGFRFSKISVECSVHLCSCPWTVRRFGTFDSFLASLDRYQVYCACCCSAPMTHKPVQQRQTIDTKSLLSKYIYYTGLGVQFTNSTFKRVLVLRLVGHNVTRLS